MFASMGGYPIGATCAMPLMYDAFGGASYLHFGYGREHAIATSYPPQPRMIPVDDRGFRIDRRVGRAHNDSPAARQARIERARTDYANGRIEVWEMEDIIESAMGGLTLEQKINLASAAQSNVQREVDVRPRNGRSYRQRQKAARGTQAPRTNKRGK